MREKILTALACIRYKVEIIEKEIDALTTESESCSNCGFLTQDQIDSYQILQSKVGELNELVQVMDYLEEMNT